MRRNVKNKPKGKTTQRQTRKKPPTRQRAKRQTNIPAMRDLASTTRVPRARTTQGAMRISHREFLGNVNPDTSNNWSIFSSYPINPGLPTTFPWLAGIATQFEMYRFHRLKFTFETATSVVTAGKLEFAFDYDAADPAPISEQALLTFKGAMTCSPYGDRRDLIADIKAMHTTLDKHYVRRATPPSATDIKTYDVANFYVAGVPTSGTLWGSIFVEYDCEFFTPQSNPPPPVVAANVPVIPSYGAGNTPSMTPFISTAIANSAANSFVNSITSAVWGNAANADRAYLNGVPLGQYIMDFKLDNAGVAGANWSVGQLPFFNGAQNGFVPLLLSSLTNAAGGANTYTEGTFRWLCNVISSNMDFDLRLPVLNTAGPSEFQYSFYPVNRNFEPNL